MDDKDVDIEEEVLPLDLTALQASVLYIACGKCLFDYTNIKKLLKDKLGKDLVSKEEGEKITEEIAQLDVLIKEMNELSPEIALIITELDVVDKKPKIIQKPNW